MIRAVGEHVHIQPAMVSAMAVCYPAKSHSQHLGFALDILEKKYCKDRFSSSGLKVNMDHSGPFDLYEGFPTRYYDIKLSTLRSITISFDERQFAEKNDWSILLYTLLDNETAVFKDVIPFNTIQPFLKPSMFDPKDGQKRTWYIDLCDINL